MNVLILGGGLQGLSCGCSLYKHHQVSIVTSDLMCRKSRFFHRVYSDIKSSDESLFGLLEKEKFDVLIPVSDLNVPFISRNKSEIESRFGVKCAVPDYSQVSQVEDKSRFMQFCKDNVIPHPETVILSDENLEAGARKVRFPALIKPNYSVGARGITKVNSLEELKEKYPTISEKYGFCTLQEFIENQDYYYNVMLYRNSEGIILNRAIIKIVRMYPIGAGSSTCCFSVENEELLQMCEGCLKKLNWVGMADFDVLQRLDTKEYKIIEINPRVPASLRAAAISGVNFPEIIVMDAMHLPIPAYNYQPGKILRYLGIDILWFLKSPNRFRTTPGWFEFFGKEIYYQDIFETDASTWWTWLAEGLGKIGKRNKRLR